MPIWIIGPDSYPHRPLQASFSSRSSHIVGIDSVNCRYCYVGSISMNDFTLPRRDFEMKLCKCGLMALILSPLQASFSPRSSHIVEIGSVSIAGIVM